MILPHYLRNPVSKPFHVYSEDGFESAHTTESAARKVAERAAKKRREEFRVYEASHGYTGGGYGSFVASYGPSDHPTVMDSERGRVFPGEPSQELIRESRSAPSGVVSARLDSAGTWQYVAPADEDFYGRVRGEAIYSVYIEE